MKKPFLSSSTSQTVAAAGTITGAAMTLGDVLQMAFPENALITNPAVTVFATFLLNSIFLPWLSRRIAAWRGK